MSRDEEKIDEEDARFDEGLSRAWETVSVPDGFADGVLAALDETGRDRDGIRNGSSPAPLTSKSARTSSLALWAMAALAAAIALAIFFWPASILRGEVSASARRSVDLGSIGTLVAEAGAELSYEAQDGHTVVEQRAGRVFYRVTPGQRFDVHTPAGEVRVRGTCFFVEVREMDIRSSLSGVALGAALATAAVVTVYEGRVVLANDHGQVDVLPGESSTVTTEDTAAPIASELDPVEPRDDRAGDRAADRVSAAEAVRPNATRTELARENARLADALSEQRRQASELQTELLRLRAERAGDADSVRPNSGRWYPASQQELQSLAENCVLRLDNPPVESFSPPDEVSEETASQLGLREGETEVLIEAMQRVHAWYGRELRALYIEATGDVDGAPSLSPRAMLGQIHETAAEGDQQILAVIARERAGLVEPPSDLSARSSAERAVRLFAQVGDELQRVLSQSLGAERAHELRASAGGWPFSRSQFAGCGD